MEAEAARRTTAVQRAKPVAPLLRRWETPLTVAPAEPARSEGPPEPAAPVRTSVPVAPVQTSAPQEAGRSWAPGSEEPGARAPRPSASPATARARDRAAPAPRRSSPSA